MTKKDRIIKFIIDCLLILVVIGAFYCAAGGLNAVLDIREAARAETAQRGAQTARAYTASVVYEKRNPESEIEVEVVETEVIETTTEIKQTPVQSPAPVVEAVEYVSTPETDDGWHVIPNCTITHYCHGVCCNGAAYAYKPLASGAWPEAGRSVAVDKSVIPLGSEVMINGHIYIAEDTGVIGNWVDIFCDSHKEALNRGMYTTEVCWR